MYTKDGINLYQGDMKTGDREATTEEIAEHEAKLIEAQKPKIVSMRQARLALFQSGLLTTITDAIANGTDEELKIEWEYATEMRRDWSSLITLADSLGLTSTQLDDLFLLASKL